MKYEQRINKMNSIVKLTNNRDKYIGAKNTYRLNEIQKMIAMNLLSQFLVKHKDGYVGMNE